MLLSAVAAFRRPYYTEGDRRRFKRRYGRRRNLSPRYDDDWEYDDSFGRFRRFFSYGDDEEDYATRIGHSAIFTAIVFGVLYLYGHA